MSYQGDTGFEDLFEGPPPSQMLGTRKAPGSQLDKAQFQEIQDYEDTYLHDDEFDGDEFDEDGDFERKHNSPVRASDIYRNPNAQSLKKDGKGKRAKRRSKNDVEGRVHICGCGKSYLSYPALYTHIKTKHGGIEPGGTKASKERSGRGRGRPRKNDYFKMAAPLAAVPEEPEPGDRTIQGAFRDISDMEFFEQLGGGKGHDANFDPLKEWPKINQTDEDDEVLKAQDLVLQAMQEHIKRTENKMPSLDWLNLDQLMGRYAAEMSQIVGVMFFKLLAIILLHFREYINFVGWRHFERKDFYILRAHQNQTGEKGRRRLKIFTQRVDGTIVHEFLSKFITEHLPSEHPYLDPPLVGTLLLHFCRWLKRNGFTSHQFDCEKFASKGKDKK